MATPKPPEGGFSTIAAVKALTPRRLCELAALAAKGKNGGDARFSLVPKESQLLLVDLLSKAWQTTKPGNHFGALSPIASLGL